MNLGDGYAYLMTRYSVPKAMTAWQIERESASEEELSRVRKAVESGDWSGLLKKLSECER